MVAIAYGLPPPLALLCTMPFPFVAAFRPMLVLLLLVVLLPPPFVHWYAVAAAIAEP